MTMTTKKEDLVRSLLLLLLTLQQVNGFSHWPSFPSHKSLTVLQSSSNVDLFSGAARGGQSPSGSDGQSFLSTLSKQFLEEQASLLRKEAEELEISMREEARAKGIPEEMINKLIPIRGKKVSQTSNVVATAVSRTVEEEEDRAQIAQAKSVPSEVVAFRRASVEELRGKIGYLNVGDAVSFSSSLNRLKSTGFLRLWDSIDLSEERFTASVGDLKFKTNIEPVSLKLDDVGYNYQNVLVSAVIIGTVCALLSSTVGGQLGFLLGYLSVLFPIAVVGVGSFAPALIGEILLQIRLKTDAEAKQRYIRMNAGKFLVGYMLGLPVFGFSSGDNGNTSEFFQLRPGNTSQGESGSKRMFSKSSYAQNDVAPSTVASIAGSVAECLHYGAASGSNAVDVHLMYELLTSVDPALPPEKMQAHIRWAAISAYNILNKHRDVYERLVEAFAERRPLEDCIAIVEGTEQ